MAKKRRRISSSSEDEGEKTGARVWKKVSEGKASLKRGKVSEGIVSTKGAFSIDCTFIEMKS